MLNKTRLALLFAIPFLFAQPLLAEESRYSSWSGGGSDTSNNQLVEELRKLIDQGERDRAADRRFLRDLRDLADRYDRPWRQELLFDDFRTNGRSDAPEWKIVSGEFRMERDYGLRSQFTPAGGTSNGGSRSVEDELASALVGALFDRKKKGEAKTTVVVSTQAESYTRRAITNAFELNLELHLFRLEREFEFRLFRGDAREAGYSLVLIDGELPTLQLQHATPYGRSVIQSLRLDTKLEDGRSHRFQWQRGLDGRMSVLLDGREVVSVVDRADREPFDGVALINRGGDFALREVVLYGSNP